MTPPRRLPAPVVRGAHGRAPLRDLQALAAKTGFPEGIAQHWRDKRMSLQRAEIDANARIGLRGRSLR